MARSRYSRSRSRPSQVGSVFEQLDEIMMSVSWKILEEVDAAAYSSAQNAVAGLRSTSPGKYYPKGWTIKRKRQGKRQGQHGKFYNIVHNATEYRLTHLLEKSHVIRNGDGTYGRTSPGHGQVVHIQPIERQCVKDFVEKVEWIVANL